MPLETFFLKTAPQFDVHKWSDFPEVGNAVNGIFEEIKALRTSKGIRIREADKVKKHLRVVLIDLWAAHTLSPNPYRAVSRNKSDYQIESRYRRIFITYNYFIGVIDDLVELEYIKQKKGHYFEADRKRTRIKATDKLIQRILSPEFGIDVRIQNSGALSIVQVNPDYEREIIILRDGNGLPIDYEDTDDVLLMRERLKRINLKLLETRITLNITNQAHQEMIQRLTQRSDLERPSIDFCNNQLHRVFNQSSFDKGGRFYGGWWQNIPREYRKFIEIGRKDTVELDYSGHHLRILYAEQGLAPPDNPYDIEDFEYEDQKLAVLIMLNAFDESKAIKAMNKSGISQAKSLIRALKTRHSSIEDNFFTGVGLDLMNKDSKLAEKVMLRMLERGATVLPVHDSFIVRSSYANELEQIMKEEFQAQFGQTASLKVKRTAREESEPVTGAIAMDLNELFEDVNNSDWVKSVWGS